MPPSTDVEQSWKSDREFVDDIEPTATHATYIDTGTAAGLSQEHQQYLLQRHGTLDLDPIPGIGDADPYNWPNWKVCRS